MVVQGALPGRGKDFRSPRDVSPDSGQAEVDAKLEQFAVDAGRAPERVDLGREILRARRSYGTAALEVLQRTRSAGHGRAAPVGGRAVQGVHFPLDEEADGSWPLMPRPWTSG